MKMIARWRHCDHYTDISSVTAGITISVFTATTSLAKSAQVANNSAIRRFVDSS